MRSRSSCRLLLSISIALPVLLAICLNGCGDGGSSGGATGAGAETSDSATAQTPPAAEKQSSAGGKQKPELPARSARGKGGSDSGSTAFKPAPLRVSGGGSAQFRVKRGDNSIVEYGEEAGRADLTAAAKVLHLYLVARAEGDLRAACAQLATKEKQQLANLAPASKSRHEGCVGALAELPPEVSPDAARALTVVDAAGLRRAGGDAILIYRGAAGTPYFVLMELENGDWKVGALSPSALG